MLLPRLLPRTPEVQSAGASTPALPRVAWQSAVVTASTFSIVLAHLTAPADPSFTSADGAYALHAPRDGFDVAPGVALGLCAGLVLLWCRARERGGPGDYALAGAVAGLAFLAHVDAAFVIFGFAVVEVVRGLPPRAVVAATLGAVVVALFWLYDLLRFGAVVQ